MLGSLLGGGGTANVPATLEEALGGRPGVLRHGELFGLPESSPLASPFLGGPRRLPVLRDEYTSRSVRIDPSLTSSGAAMISDSSKTSRLTLGEAASLVASGDVPLPSGADLSLTSRTGDVPLDLEDWRAEFAAAEEKTAAGGARVFRTTFGSVPDLERLTDWMATKWAPAVLRTYDLAGIRVGARPVYANRVKDTNDVEIVWQRLVDFDSVTVGRMLIEVREEGIVARRGPGDAAKGFGAVSDVPLAGEDVLVRRLADAASQAVEKGLANKPKTEKKPKQAPKTTLKAAPTPVSTVASSGTVAAPAAPAAAATTTTTTTTAASDAGPRSAGARRSSERTRGSRRRRKDADAGAEAAPAKEDPEAFQ